MMTAETVDITIAYCLSVTSFRSGVTHFLHFVGCFTYCADKQKSLTHNSKYTPCFIKKEPVPNSAYFDNCLFT